MNGDATHADLIREAESLKLYRGAIEGLGPRLPENDEDLHRLLARLVATKNELAFPRIVLAALCAGRRVDASHLVEGAALFPEPESMSSAAWHCSGEVGVALVDAVKAGLMGIERETTALAVAAAWSKGHPEFAFPSELIPQARLVARDAAYNFLACSALMVVANLLDDEGLRAVLRGYGAPDHPLLEEGFLEEFLGRVRRPPLSLLPEKPPPTEVSGFTVRRAVERVGRNDPCPCGSGKKYKKCCYDKDRERLLQSSAVAGLTRSELRQQPELGLTLEGIQNMRSYEVCKLDPGKVPPNLRIPFADRLMLFGLLDQVVGALEAWPMEHEALWVWDLALMEVVRKGSKPLLERLLRLKPGALDALTYNRLTIDLVLAGDDGRRQLDLVEAAALKALQAERPAAGMVDLAYCLLNTRPALGIVATRGAIPMTNEIEADTLLEQLLRARDKLNLPPDDPMCDVVDAMLFAPRNATAEEPEELVKARQELQAKARETRKLQKEIEQLHRKLGGRESQPPPPLSAARYTPPQPPSTPFTLPEPPSASLLPPALSESEAKALRERLESLKGLLKERHNERNQLRHELKAARAKIESLQRRPAPPPAAATADDAEIEEQLLDSEQVQSRQTLRLPEFPRRFQEQLTALPQATARACVAMAGRLAAGEVSAFVGVKRLKALPDVYRQRIGEDYRLLFRLWPGRLEIVDLVHRRDLERKIRAMG